MSSRIATAKPDPFPMILKYTDIRSYVLTFVFVLLDLLVPWAFHQIHLAGPTFLPMHIFVLVAGLLFGWRAGLMIGLLSPLTSYAISGMPALPILPQIVAELATYGLVAGMLREKLNLGVIWSLAGAMIAGRLALCLAVLAIYLTTGEVSSPLGIEANPLFAVWSTVRQGWPGMIVQLATIPAIIWLLGRAPTKAFRSK